MQRDTFGAIPQKQKGGPSHLQPVLNDVSRSFKKKQTDGTNQKENSCFQAKAPGYRRGRSAASSITWNCCPALLAAVSCVAAILSNRRGQVITTLLSSAIAPCTVVMNTQALNSSLRLSQQERTNENRCWVGTSCLPTPSPGPTSELKLIPEIPAKGTESQHCRSSLPPDHWGPALGI